MNLGEIIEKLEKRDPKLIVPNGFSHPHSYRGYYWDLAFEPDRNTTVGEMLEAARSAVGTTYQGWKGGDFTMDVYSDCWLSMEGECSGDSLSAMLLDYILDEAERAK